MAEHTRALKFEDDGIGGAHLDLALKIPKVISINEIVRPIGYAIPAYKNFHCIVEGNGVRAEGWGTGPLLEGIEKAKSEAFERYVFSTTPKRSDKKQSSSGWAAHLTSLAARDAAVAELIERDSALSAWLNNGLYLTVPRNLWPIPLVRWSESAVKMKIEFCEPHVLLSVGSNGCCATVILKNRSGCAVTGHASGFNLEQSLVSAFFEALRSAHAALRFEDFAQVMALHNGDETVHFSPGANAMSYAYGVSLPELNVVTVDESEITKYWERHLRQLAAHTEAARVDYFDLGDRVVAHAQLDNVLQIFWGPTPRSWTAINKHPHIVG